LLLWFFFAGNYKAFFAAEGSGLEIISLKLEK